MSLPRAAGMGSRAAPAGGSSYSEVDEALIRGVFLKNRRSELFVPDTPDLAKSSQEYQEWFQVKEDRRKHRFEERLKKANGDIKQIPVAELKELGKKGIPSEHRAAVYEHMLDLASFEAKYGSEYFTKCLKADIPSSIGRVIQVDIPRTLSGFLSTCGDVTKTTLMKMLRDVLWSFAVHKPEIGYCQSMNFIAAYFISVFGSAKKSFYALVQLIDSPTSPYVGLHVPGYYAPGMTQLLTDISILELMCRKRLGERAFRDFFDSREIASLSMIVSEWFLTLCVTVFPLRTAQRVMDLVITNGAGSSKVLLRIAFVLIRELVNRKNELTDLDQVMQGHKRITKQWVRHNELIHSATKGLRLFSKREVEKWRKIVQVASKNSSQHSSSSQPVGNTMMRLEEAIASTTVLNVPSAAVPRDTLSSVPEEPCSPPPKTKS